MTNSINQGVFSSLPKEIGSLIFSYLGVVEKGTASKVCKYWKELLQPKLIEMLHVSKLEKRKIVSRLLNITTDLPPASSFLLLSNGEAYMFYKDLPCRRMQFDMSKEPTAANDTKEVENNISPEYPARLLAETDKYLFFAVEIDRIPFQKLTCIQKDTGEHLFNVEPNNPRSDFVHFAVLQNNPLKFLIISDQTFVIYSFIHKILKVEEVFLHMLPSRPTQAYYLDNNELLFSYADPNSFFRIALFNLNTKQITKSNLKNHTVLDAKFMIFQEKSINGIAVKRFKVVDGQFHQIYQIGFVNSVAYVFNNLLFVIDSFHIRILDANDGKALFSLKLPDKRLFDEVHQNKNLKVRFFANNVALMAGPLLILIDLKSGSNVLKEFNKNINLVDCDIKHGYLYVLYNLFIEARFDALKLQEVSLNEPSLAELPSFEVKTNEETVFESPVEQVTHEIPPSNHNTYQKTAVIALLIITSSLMGLSIYFGIMGSINLSIGFGTASALTAAGAGYAAFKIKQKYLL